MSITIDEMASFCKRKGLVYPSAEIYGGLAGFFDFGPLGVELKNNLKTAWWNFHVTARDDIVGIDGSIITNPKVWQASGHVESFEDVMVEDAKTHEKFRADQLVEDVLKVPTDGLSADQLWVLIEKNDIKSPSGNSLLKPEQFNLMFTTQVGPKSDSSAKSYLRPETAQLIFANFKLVQENARLKLPFGIAQVGKAFRNEISPRDFLFRCREFEQMEIEYFVDPKKANDCPYLDSVKDHEVAVYSAEMQDKKKDPKKYKIKDAVKEKIIKTPWHAYWLATEHQWFISLGAKPDNFRIRQHLDTEKSHYALDTWDLEYKFPFGWKELQGMANRTDFDLSQHMKVSKKELKVFDEETKEKVTPHVIAEPSQGVERALLVFLFDAYDDDKKRGNIVLHLHPKLAPFKIGVFPLVNKLKEVSKKLYDELKHDFPTFYDASGSIGRRYARADEIGIPFCITVDFDTLKDKKVTVRNRETTEQERVEIKDLKTKIMADLCTQDHQRQDHK